MGRKPRCTYLLVDSLWRSFAAQQLSAGFSVTEQQLQQQQLSAGFAEFAEFV